MREEAGLALSILELRAYARAKQAVDSAQKPEDVSDWQRAAVFEVVAEIIKRRRAAPSETP